jgi:transposase
VQVQRLLDTVAAGTAAFRHLYNSVGERLMTELGLSQRHACELMSLQRSRARYVSHPRSIEAATVARIREYSHG